MLQNSTSYSEIEKQFIKKMVDKYDHDKRYNNRPIDVSYEVKNIYSLRSKFGRYFEAEKLYYLIELLNHSKISLSGMNVLDIGCHSGLILNMIAHLKGTARGLTGIDMTRAYVRRARQINSSIDFRVENALDMKPGSRYHLILFIYVLSEIFPLSLRARVIASATSMQRKGDYILIFNFRRLPLLLHYILTVAQPIASLFGVTLPSPKFGRSVNLDDVSVKEQFPGYRLVKSYSFINLFAREAIHNLKIPVGLMRLVSKVWPKYYMVLLKKTAP